MTSAPAENLSDDFPLTMESLHAIALKSAIETDFGVELDLDVFFERCTLGVLADEIQAVQVLQGARNIAFHHFEPRPESAFEPFPLTDVQHAYWLGSQAFELGGRSAHVYGELDVFGVDVAPLEIGLNRLIAGHPMLRAVLLPDGRQKVLAEVPPFRIRGCDLRGSEPEAVERALADTRAELGQQRFDATVWPLFDIRAHTVDTDKVRLCISIDMLFADAGSMEILASDWLRYVVDDAAAITAPEVSFRDYVIATERLRATPEYAAARDYWTNRIDDFAPTPQLPVQATTTGAEPPEFTRRTARLSATEWQGLKHCAQRLGVTKSVLLGAAYALVLRTWSSSPRFTLNLTFADRPRWHPDLARVIGDFSSTILLECDLRTAADLDTAARRMQAQLRADLANRLYSGVHFQRDIARRWSVERAAMPVVFTALIRELGAADFDGLIAPSGFGISQTPQVYLDNQVISHRGELIVNWDAVEAIFPAEVLDDMFAAYLCLLRRAADEYADPDATALTVDVPLYQRLSRPTSMVGAGSAALIHDELDAAIAATPDAPAIIGSTRVLTFGELDRYAAGVANMLCSQGVSRGRPVAVLMRKGWEQIAAVLAVVRCAAAYVPIDAELPPDRIGMLVAASGAGHVIVQPGVVAPAGVAVVTVDDTLLALPVAPLPPRPAADELAYVIFTSGSTGTPKGVMISHRAAVNTIDDLNRRLAVSADDRVLGISALNFDLSVYDIFGVLGRGGAIVLPDVDKVHNPRHWCELIDGHRVTMWNTVPALLELLVDECEQRVIQLPHPFRVAMLSGDWIPLSLPDRARVAAAGPLSVLGLGGATEAAIWSIYYPIGAVDPSWRSIPYGRQLDNQTVEVLSDDLVQTPDHVIGEIHIGGLGVALGYLDDPERTAERFHTDQAGRRLYRTGDLGRYLPDGNIEFLGRNDFQVKIAGHRIELGEIEHALLQHPEIRAAVVTTDPGGQRLVAYFVAESGTAVALSDEVLRAHLAQRLPHYMVPQLYLRLDALPLSANGKVDRGALPTPQHEQQPYEPPANRTEAVIADAWVAVLSVDRIGRHDQFLAVGGDSLLAIRIMARLADAELSLTVREFYENPTVAGQAKLARPRPNATRQDPVPTGPVALTASQSWFFEREFADQDHWNGMWPMFEIEQRFDLGLLADALAAVTRRHEALRMRFERADSGWLAVVPEDPSASMTELTVIDLSSVPDELVDSELATRVAESHAGLSLTAGPSVRVAYFELGATRKPRLLISSHWVVMDYYSSRVFYEDLVNAYLQFEVGATVQLPPRTASLASAALALRTYADSAELAEEVPYWRAIAETGWTALPRDHVLGPNVQSSIGRHITSLSGEAAVATTRVLPRSHDVEVRDVLLWALTRAVAEWTETPCALVEVEGHGRDGVFGDLDVTRTISRFSTLSPVLLRVGHTDDPLAELVGVRDQLRAVPNRGTGFGLLRYLMEDHTVRDRLRAVPVPEIGFNYWGDVSEYFTQGARPLVDHFGEHRSETGMRPRVVDVMALTLEGQVHLVWTYSRNLHGPETIARLADRVHELLCALAAAAVEEVR
ncbi:amino acid adenylation domain-containing protein [Nocardia sp. NBC_00508]|uniref:amino acid adenylation domain-containing protein n=1 Tax=Nocardia sp. NBC_00508 TaxID=2975992 RepID=UPI002E7FDD8D|nr:amino acid adenylation domain-containing protein [Nocardia sp. NBC_00508]WUD64693.1 amino acid adenylation domain-containing protein [Nocardia sp. NBC_00508]